MAASWIVSLACCACAWAQTTNVITMQPGQWYPVGYSESQVSRPVREFTPPDSTSLVTNSNTNIVFLGSRLMSTRLNERLNTLAANVQAFFSGAYRLVLYAGSLPPIPNYSQNYANLSLQYEGRAAFLGLTGVTAPSATEIGQLGGLAIVSNLDWVLMLNTTQIYVSVIPSTCETKVDLVFLLDGSSSISPSNFAIALNFVSQVISYFDIGPTATHVGLSVFSGDVTWMSANTSRWPNCPNNSIFEYHAAGTNVDGSKIYDSFGCICQFKQPCSGVDQSCPRGQMFNASNQLEFTFYYPFTCTTCACGGPPLPYIYPAYQLSNYTTSSSLLAATSRVAYPRGNTLTSLALQYARETMFTVANGARPLSDGVPRVLVVLTDGLAHPGYEPTAQADLLHADGVKVFSIGIGNFSNSQLVDMASDPVSQHVYALSTFTQLYDIVSRMSVLSCDASAPLQPGWFIDRALDDTTAYFSLSCYAFTSNFSLVLITPNGTTAMYVSSVATTPGPFRSDFRSVTNASLQTLTFPATNTSRTYVAIEASKPNTRFRLYASDVLFNLNAVAFSTLESSPLSTVVVPASTYQLLVAVPLVYELYTDAGVRMTRPFSINNITGAITISGPLDFETQVNHTLLIVARSAVVSCMAAIQPISVTVVNVNEAPFFTQTTYAVQLSSYLPLGTNITRVIAADPEGATVSYAWAAAGGGSLVSNFALDASTGVVTLASYAGLPLVGVLNGTVVASDGALTSSATVIINVSLQATTIATTSIPTTVTVTTSNTANTTTTTANTATTATTANTASTTSNTATNTASTTANTASTTANTASTTANTASTTANTASTTANTASTTANTASTTANTASTTANTASTTANTASTTANTASTTANTASTTANTASTTVNTASTNTASITANMATTTANTANTTVNTDTSIANTASTTANTASTTANTATTTANTTVNTDTTTANTASTTANTATTTANTASTTANTVNTTTTTANTATTTANTGTTTANTATTIANTATTTANTASTTANTASTTANTASTTPGGSALSTVSTTPANVTGSTASTTENTVVLTTTATVDLTTRTTPDSSVTSSTGAVVSSTLIATESSTSVATTPSGSSNESTTANSAGGSTAVTTTATSDAGVTSTRSDSSISGGSTTATTATTANTEITTPGASATTSRQRRGPSFSGTYSGQVTNDQPVNSTVLTVRAEPNVANDVVSYSLGSNIEGLFGIESTTGRIYIAVSPATLARRRSSSLFNSTVVFSVVAAAGGVNSSTNITVGLFAGCSPCPCVDGYACSPTCNPAVNFCSAPESSRGLSSGSTANSSAGMAAGAAVGGLALLILLVLLVILLLRRRAHGQRMGGKPAAGQTVQPPERANSTVGNMFNNPLFKRPKSQAQAQAQAPIQEQPTYETLGAGSQAGAATPMLYAPTQGGQQGMLDNPLFVSPAQQQQRRGAPGSYAMLQGQVAARPEQAGYSHATGQGVQMGAAHGVNPQYAGHYEAVEADNTYDVVPDQSSQGAARAPYDQWALSASTDPSMGNPMYGGNMEPSYNYPVQQGYDTAHMETHYDTAGSRVPTQSRLAPAFVEPQYDSAGSRGPAQSRLAPAYIEPQYDSAHPADSSHVAPLFFIPQYETAGSHSGQAGNADSVPDAYHAPMFYAATEGTYVPYSSGHNIPYDTTATLPPLPPPTHLASHRAYDSVRNGPPQNSPARRPSVVVRTGNAYELAMDHSSA